MVHGWERPDLVAYQAPAVRDEHKRVAILRPVAVAVIQPETHNGVMEFEASASASGGGLAGCSTYVVHDRTAFGIYQPVMQSPESQRDPQESICIGTHRGKVTDLRAARADPAARLHSLPAANPLCSAAASCLCLCVSTRSACFLLLRQCPPTPPFEFYRDVAARSQRPCVRDARLGRPGRMFRAAREPGGQIQPEGTELESSCCARSSHAHAHAHARPRPASKPHDDPQTRRPPRVCRVPSRTGRRTKEKAFGGTF
ncbi:hypothetical protein EVG20_g6200 [Dentipellis fragilis]|uniref:Uncharacterized protein n=1 Tax=Dentipellis fragilis TaxID=205917 RepID=A0A4Y9YPK0_9AGAM|nr:hypothetical protein EVG20_g6200 [Dentipellis fragilis]